MPGGRRARDVSDDGYVHGTGEGERDESPDYETGADLSGVSRFRDRAGDGSALAGLRDRAANAVTNTRRLVGDGLAGRADDGESDGPGRRPVGEHFSPEPTTNRSRSTCSSGG